MLCARPVAPTPPLKQVKSRWRDFPGASSQLKKEHGNSIAHKSDYSNAAEKLPNQNSVSNYRESFDSKK